MLVIEDDRRSAELLELYLDGSGLKVVLARDGAEGSSSRASCARAR